jgi:hypothetical protein
MRLIAGALAVTSLIFLSGCLNIFSGLDSPSGDPQVYSAGRSCLDQGNYSCALAEFKALSSSSSDNQAADSAFTILAQNGAGSGVLIQNFGTGVNNVGAAFNSFVADFPNASTTLRASIYTAYQQVQNMTPNTPLRGLVRFVSATAFLAEVLAEGASTTGTLKQMDIAVSPSACLNLGVFGCSIGGACSGTGATGKFISGPGKFSSAGLDDYISSPTNVAIAGPVPTFDMISGAVSSILNSLAANELNGTGSFGGTTLAFVNTLSGFAINTSPTDSPCFRYGLLSLGVGQ